MTHAHGWSLLPESRREKQRLAVVVGLGFLARLAFVLVGARFIWGADAYVHGDTPYFVAASTNLVDTGVLTADPTYADATFSRVPMYSLLWALIYAFLGASATYRVVAALQVVADLLAIVLVYDIARRLAGRERPALLAALVYATYPFVIFWVTPNVPDAFTTAVSLAVVAVLTRHRPSWAWAISLGALLAVAALTREYLLPLVGVAVLYIAHNRARDERWIARAAVVCAVAAVVYAPWPARNYFGHGRFVLQRAPSAGSRFYAPDIMAARKWVGAFESHPGPLLEEIARGEGEVGFPPWVFADDEERRFAHELTERARACGTGFNTHARDTTFSDEDNCDAELVSGYDRLRRSFVGRHFFTAWGRIPLENIGKAFFKYRLVEDDGSNGVKTLVVQVLFHYRTVLVLLGVAGFVWFRKERRLLPLASFVALIMFYMCVLLRGLQMRYLLQTDVWLFIPAAMLVDVLIAKIRREPLPHPLGDDDARRVRVDRERDAVHSEAPERPHDAVPME